MVKNLFAIATAALLLVGSQVWAGPAHRGGHIDVGRSYGGGDHYRGSYYGGHYRGWSGYRRPGIGIYYGWPGYSYGFGYAYPYPYSNAPLVINADPTPQVLIQRDSSVEDMAQIDQPTSYWYYCTQPPGYYPYVQNCSQSWMKVVPQIPADQAVAPRAVP